MPSHFELLENNCKEIQADQRASTSSWNVYNVALNTAERHSSMRVLKGKDITIFHLSKSDANLRDQLDFDWIHTQLHEDLNIEPGKIVQIIGDSNPFGEEGHRYALNYLKARLEKHKGLVLYGYTSNKNGNANGLVGQWIGSSEDRAERVIANVVYPETFTAVNEWGCTISDPVKNFFVVGSKDGPAGFGDDAYLSDNLADTLICFEGGVQSLLQIVNTLKFHDKPKIILIHGLRNTEHKPWFSAAEFVERLQEANSESELTKIKDEYLREHPLWDPNGNPPSKVVLEKKREQFEGAFEQLTELDGILEKLETIYIKKTGARC